MSVGTECFWQTHSSERIFHHMYKSSQSLKQSMWRSVYRYLKQGCYRLSVRQRDETLHTLKAIIQQGWPDDKSALPSVVSPYFNTRDEMSVQDGLIFKEERVVLPKVARLELLRRIQHSHLAVNGCLTEDTIVFIGLTWPATSRIMYENKFICNFIIKPIVIQSLFDHRWSTLCKFYSSKIVTTL